MPGENIETSHNTNPEATQWDNLAQEVPFDENGTETTAEQDLGAKVQEALSTMDQRTAAYIWDLGSNVTKLFGEEQHREEDKLFSHLFFKELNQNLADGKLNGAYLNADGYLYNGDLASEYRGYDEAKDAQPYEETLDTTAPLPAETTHDQHQDNFNTLDPRTQIYIRRFAENLPILVSKDLSDACISILNHTIEQGKLKDAYFNDQGILYTGNLAKEYRGYDEKAHKEK